MSNEWELASGVLRLSAQLVDGVQRGLADRGFDDVRPVHGFAFAVLSTDTATAADLAGALDVSKQAAGQLVDHLVERGYVTRVRDEHDRRVRRLVLTARGRACTAAAEAAATDVVRAWRDGLPASAYAGLARSVELLADPGRLRPAW